MLTWLFANTGNAANLASQTTDFATNLLLAAVTALAAVVLALWRQSQAERKKELEDNLERENELRAQAEKWETKYEAEHAARIADQKQATEALLRAAEKNHEGVAHLHEIAQAIKR